MTPSGYTGLPGYSDHAGSNELTLDRQGRIVFCEHGDRRVSVLTPGAGKRTLADNYQGRRFNSPNDCTVDAAGAIYFTDPPYGLPEGPQDKKFRELDWCGVYRIAPDGVHVMRPDGKRIARIDPRMACGNCCFGGDDGSWLSICGDAFRVRIQTKTRGWP
jgi:sugar lactone lactonase YvrE